MQEVFGATPEKAFLDRDLLLVYGDGQTVREMTPDFEKMKALPGGAENFSADRVRGVLISAANLLSFQRVKSIFDRSRQESGLSVGTVSGATGRFCRCAVHPSCVLCAAQKRMKKMAKLNIRIEDAVKRQAESVLSDLGLNMTSAVTVFLRQVIRCNGIPFPLHADPFYSVENWNRLLVSKERMDRNGNNGIETPRGAGRSDAVLPEPLNDSARF